MDPTTQTYDRIAREFAERNWDIRLERALEGFTRRLPVNAAVLDLGCGPGRDIAILRERGFRVVGADLSTGMLMQAQARSGGALVCSDMRHLPFVQQWVDGIWVCAALLHLPRADAPLALAEMRRVLRPGGLLYLSVKQGPSESWDHSMGPRLFTYYELEPLAEMVTHADLKIAELWMKTEQNATWISIIAIAGSNGREQLPASGTRDSAI